MQKNIIVACGVGSVTSRTIAVKLESFFRKNKMDVKVATCKVHEVRSKVAMRKYDLIVSSTPVPECGVRNIVALSLLTGVGEEKVLEQIKEELTD